MSRKPRIPDCLTRPWCATVGRCLPTLGAAPRTRGVAAGVLLGITQSRRNQMPVILWLLGVPLLVVVLLMLLNVI